MIKTRIVGMLPDIFKSVGRRRTAGLLLQSVLALASDSAIARQTAAVSSRIQRMTYKEFNRFCRSLAATTYVMQWGGSHVWKVGGKVFAIGGWQDDKPSFTFKVSDIAYEMLKEQPGLRPAPYLASRGMKWIQHFAEPGLSDAGLRDYIRQSHAIVAQGLSKKKRIALRLAPGVEMKPPGGARAPRRKQNRV